MKRRQRKIILDMRNKSIVRAVIIAGVALVIYGCATTSGDWQEARRQGSIVAYEKFLENHPDAEQAEWAKHAIWKLQTDADWKKALSIDTLDGYNDFLTKNRTRELKEKAESAIAHLKSSKGWEEAKTINTIAGYKFYLEQTPEYWFANEARKTLKSLEEKRDWEATIAANSTHAYNLFLENYPSSLYADEARKRLEHAALSEAVDSGTDDALVAFILQSDTESLTMLAIKNLKGYDTLQRGNVILWASLPKVYAGIAKRGSEVYPCGIDSRAFSNRPLFGLGSWLTVGSKNFFKPDSNEIELSRWTKFDGYIAKGSALITAHGLKFDKDSIVLKRR